MFCKSFVEKILSVEWSESRGEGIRGEPGEERENEVK